MIGTRDKTKTEGREWTDDRWHKGREILKWRGMSGGISQNSGGIITDKAV
jgi:hypothetical protein